MCSKALTKFLMATTFVMLGAACSHEPKESDEYLLRPVKSGSTHRPRSALPIAGQDLQQSVRFSTLSKNIRFDYASADINASTRKALDTMASEINSSLDSFDKIRVSGFTDSSGDGSRNQRLSQQRAENVRRYLISKGVPPDKIESIGRGAAESPVAGTKMKAAADRRVDFEIVR